MDNSLLPKIVIVVSGSHWQCVTCQIHKKRTVSLDEHLVQKHPYVSLTPHISGPAEGTLSDGEDYEHVEQMRDAAGRRNEKTRKSSSQVSQWLDKPDFDTSDDNNDDDSDFVPSELERKKVVSTKTTRKSLRKHKQQKSLKLNRQQKQKEQPETKPEPENRDPLLDFQSATEKELKTEASDDHDEEEDYNSDDNNDDDEDFKPRTQSARKRHMNNEQHSSFPLGPKRSKKHSLECVVVDSATPRKRGRPPKPKPVPGEGEDLPAKRPYRKRVPDPSELLLKLRNVGRKPNTRTQLAHKDREAVKANYSKFISKGVPLAGGVDLSHNAGNNLSLVDGDPQDTDRQTVKRDNTVAGEAASSSVSQQDEGVGQDKIRCKTCLSLFTSQSVLKEHLNTVSEEDVFQCLACEMKFHGLIDLNIHVFCDHEYEKQPACFLCDEDFSSMEKLEKHLNSQHKGEQDAKLADTRFHDCRLCSMELNVDFQLIKNHYYRRHKAYVCPECYGKDVDLLYYTDTILYGEHKQMHAKSPAECTICRMAFPTAREMKTHMWTHAEDTTEDGTGGKCSKCDKWLPNSGAMLMHEKEHKNEAIRKNYALEASIGFPCMKCEHIFSSKSNLKKHSCKADPNRAFYFHCEYCAHGCNTKEQLRDHIALHHLGIKRYACEYCDSRFVCAPTLRRHIRRVHTKEKPYECHICKERFFERNLMLRHVSKHTGIASFVCEFCGKGFHTKFDLKKHVENHSDSRDFVCPHCGMDYKRSYHLKRHLEKGCKKKLPGTAGSTAISEAPKLSAAAQEDADEMVYIDLAQEVSNDDDQGEEDNDVDYDDSSGPDYIDDEDEV